MRIPILDVACICMLHAVRNLTRKPKDRLFWMQVRARAGLHATFVEPDVTPSGIGPGADRGPNPVPTEHFGDKHLSRVPRVSTHTEPQEFCDAIATELLEHAEAVKAAASGTVEEPRVLAGALST